MQACCFVRAPTAHEERTGTHSAPVACLISRGPAVSTNPLRPVPFADYSKVANGLTRCSFSVKAVFSASVFATANRARSFFNFTLRVRRRAISRDLSIRPIVLAKREEKSLRQHFAIHSQGKNLPLQSVFSRS